MKESDLMKLKYGVYGITTYLDILKLVDCQTLTVCRQPGWDQCRFLRKKLPR